MQESVVVQLVGRKRGGADLLERRLSAAADAPTTSTRMSPVPRVGEGSLKAGCAFRRVRSGSRNTRQPAAGDDRLARLATEVLTLAVGLACELDDARRVGRRP